MRSSPPAICFDLRRSCSLVEHFVEAGRPTYLVEYGVVSFRNRSLGIEHWVDEVIPEAIREVSRHAGRPVHVIGWSLGGIFALLTWRGRPTRTTPSSETASWRTTSGWLGTARAASAAAANPPTT